MSRNKTNEPSHQASDQSGLTLVDIALIGIKHRKIFAITAFTTLLLSIVFILRSSFSYEYRTILEIGSYSPPQSEGDAYKKIPLISFQQAKYEIENIYIPTALRHYAKTNQPLRPKYNIAVDAPENSNLIILSSESEKGDSTLLELLATIGKQTVNSHISSIKNIIEQEMQRKNELEYKLKKVETELVTDQGTLETEKKRLGSLSKERSILENRLAEIESALKSISTQKTKTLSKSNSSEVNMLILYLENELYKLKEYKQKIEDRLLIEIEDEISQINLTIKKIELSQSLKKLEKNQLSERLARFSIVDENPDVLSNYYNIWPSKIVLEPIQADEPQNSVFRKLAMVTIMLTLPLGLVMCFVSEYVFLVKERLRNEHV